MVNALLKRIGMDPWTLLSGFLMVISFPPFDLSPLIYVAWLPWFVALDRSQTLKQRMLQGFWLCFLMSIGGFYWVSYTIAQFGKLPLFVGILGLLIFACFNQIQVTLFSAAYHFLLPLRRVKPIHWMLTCAFVYTCIDGFTPKIFMDTVGHSQYNLAWIRQLTEWGGALSLTLVIMSFNFGLYLLVLDRSELRHRIAFGVGMAFLVMTLVYGSTRYYQIQARIENPERTLQLAALQANVGDFHKVAAMMGVRGAIFTVLNRHIEMGEKALKLEPKPEGIVWPETAYPGTFGNSRSSTGKKMESMMYDFLDSAQVPLLFGGYDRDIPTRQEFNSFFMLTRDRLQSYRKSVLLPFGEYIPLADLFPIIKRKFPQVGFFGRGPGPSTYEVNFGAKKTVRITPMICYEALVSSFASAAAKKDSELFVNVTNDSWFGRYSEPQIHLAQTTFRSIETRLPQLRATNTGISALIDQTGAIQKPTGIYTQEILNVTIPLFKSDYGLLAKWGEWFRVFALLMSVALLLLNRRHLGVSEKTHF